MLYNIPIESLEERYSAQWNQWFPREFTRLGVRFETIDPPCEGLVRKHIVDGAFLDVLGTNIYKNVQMFRILRAAIAGEIMDGDVFFFHDLWFPGLEALFYIRDGMGLDIKIAGLLHAGTYDPHDFLTQKGMRKWGKHAEACWFEGVDLVMVATKFHADLLLTNLHESGVHHSFVSRLRVVPFPLMILGVQSEKEDLIVFPHRLAPEKAPHEFDAINDLALHETSARFVKTKDECSTKAEYYHLLRKAKVAVSTARQETWGIAMQEALTYNCIPVVPDRLSYRELFPREYRYNTLEEAADMAARFANNYEHEEAREIYRHMRAANYMRNHSAISEMVDVMRCQGWKL